MLRKYPIGLQSFQEIRKGGYVYIDKTEIIYRMVETGKYYFLSRPRRFGKSLLVSTIEQLFKGSQELFEGLWIHDRWDWSQTHPVIHFSFSNMGVSSIGLEEALYGALEDNANRLGVTLTKNGYDQQFRELIEKVSARGQVVILIDEYDKSIIDFLEDTAKVEANRAIMKNFYSILKDSDAHIRFLLMTGVSQFSRVSVFSDLNNLRNITLSTQYGAIAGITQTELEDNFAPEIAALKKERPGILAQIKDWYNGYSWDLKTRVYNPFSLLNFMIEPEFQSYWFETGTPSFLFKVLKKKDFYDIESIEMGRLELSDLNIEYPSPGALLFQTGYLTLKSLCSDGDIYTLGFPNREVKASFLDGLLSSYRETYPVGSITHVAKIKTALRNADIPAFISQLNSLIAAIPYDHWNAGKASIFTIVTFLTFKLAGIDVYTEVHSSKGRCDVLAMTEHNIYALELKLDGTAEEALLQIKQKGYLQPYGGDSRKKLAVGIAFSSETRMVSAYLVEQY